MILHAGHQNMHCYNKQYLQYNGSGNDETILNELIFEYGKCLLYQTIPPFRHKFKML